MKLGQSEAQEVLEEVLRVLGVVLAWKGTTLSTRGQDLLRSIALPCSHPPPQGETPLPSIAW